MSPALWWIVAGFALMIGELFATAFVMIFLGLAAVLTGVALLAGLPGDGGVPYILFSVLALAMVLLFRKRLRERLDLRGRIVQDDGRDEDFLGRHAVVLSGFDGAAPHRGLIQFRGTQWNAQCTDGPYPKDQRVLITAREGALLTVEATEE